jgi:hypothetical protein
MVGVLTEPGAIVCNCTSPFQVSLSFLSSRRQGERI